MSQHNSKDHNMKWMGIAIVVCGALPIAIFLFLGGGLGFLFGGSNQQPSTNQSTIQSASQLESQPTAVNVSLEKAAN